MIQFDIHFKNPNNGETVVYQDGFDWTSDNEMTPERWVIYMYTEGNYACDCNRSNFMEVDDLDLDCGHTIELLKIVERDTDRVVWPDEYEEQIAVEKAQYKYRLNNNGIPGKLFVYEGETTIGEAFPKDISISGWNLEFKFYQGVSPIPSDKSITDFKFLDGEMVFNVS